MKNIIAAVFLAGIFGLSVQYASFKLTSISPLPNLPIPKNALVYLPDPLEFVPVVSTVLGAQTIEGNDIVKYVNIEREKSGAKPLRINPVLTKGASMRADVILKYQNFSHQDPFEGIELLTVLPRLNYYFAYASENIGMGGVSAEDFVGGFMNSTAHRENLLNPALVESGSYVVTGPYKQYYVNIAVQLFAIPADRQTYLGYSSEDVKYYAKLLTDLNDKLSFTRSFIDKKWGNESYYKGWEVLLLRQKDIIKELYAAMLEDKPLTQRQRQLIFEYNSNWSKAPKNNA